MSQPNTAQAQVFLIFEYVLLFALLAFVCGCGAAMPSSTAKQHPLACPVEGGAAWREHRSTHFVMKTPLKEEQANTIVQAMETLRSAMLTAMSLPLNEPTPPLEIVLFETSADFQTAMQSSQIGGIAIPWSQSDLEVAPIIAAHGHLSYGMRSTLLHELTHIVVRHRNGKLSWWLSEGLAELYSTLWVKDVERGIAVVGDSPLDVDFWESDETTIDYREKTPKLWLPNGSAPRLNELLSATAGGIPSKSLDAYYAAAGKLLRVLSNTNQNGLLNDRFPGMLEQIFAGTPGEIAFAQAWSDVPPAVLQAEYERSLNDHDDHGEEFAFRPPPPAKIDVTALEDADVHALWARLLSNAKNGEELAENELARGEYHSPGGKALAYTRATLRLRTNSAKSSSTDIQTLLRNAPENPGYLVLAIVELEQKKQKAPLGKEDEARLEALVRKLGTQAQSATQKSLAGEALFAMGEREDGLILAQRSAGMDPGCWPCAMVLAKLYLSLESIEDASREVQRAAALIPHGISFDPLKKLFEQIEAARAKRAASKPN